MKKKIYIPLHNHSHYSLLDALSKPSQIAERCKSNGITSCALTDHGSISGAVSFYKEMRNSDIKPILGCEMYISKQTAKNKIKSNSDLSHMLVIAKNLTGWNNLIKLVSKSNLEENYYYKPRLSLDEFEDSALDGLLCITGHAGSNLADAIMNDPETGSLDTDYLDKTELIINKLKDLFGSSNLFLEAQLMDKDYYIHQVKLTEIIRQLGKKHNIKVIATNDAHYANREDAIDQRVLLCNTLKTTMPEINKKLLNNERIPLGCFFRSDNFYILSPEEMNNLHTEEEIENTLYVDSLCENYDILKKPQLPKFIDNEDERLRQLCREGWLNRGMNTLSKEEQNIYVDRIKEELGVLQGANLSGYFLIVQDIVDYVRSQNLLPGPGRGSAAGCLVSYLIGITSVDPIKYNLLFERFYNAGRNSSDRISMPDIDIDVPMTYRDQIIQYIKDKYGSSNVSQMITFNTLKGRGALKEVLRVYNNITFDEMNQITKNIPEESKIADDLQEMKEDTGEASIIRWALENSPEKFRDWCELQDDGSCTGPFAKRFEQAMRLEGIKCTQSKHAAGIAISASSLSEICPMVYDTKTGNTIAGMEMQDLESLGIVKFDILGIGMLDKIMYIQSLLKENNRCQTV
jgi:DNA polymerase-3 subunit alpha